MAYKCVSCKIQFYYLIITNIFNHVDQHLLCGCYLLILKYVNLYYFLHFFFAFLIWFLEFHLLPPPKHLNYVLSDFLQPIGLSNTHMHRRRILKLFVTQKWKIFVVLSKRSRPCSCLCVFCWQVQGDKDRLRTAYNSFKVTPATNIS